MAESVEIRDVELLRRLASGDEDAFLEFYRRHQGGIYRYAMHMTGSPQSAADVVQETFLTLIRHSGKYDPEKGAPAAFLFGIARNHLRKLHEKEGRYVSLSDEFANGLSSGASSESGPTNGNGRLSAMPGQAEMIVEGLEHAQITEMLHDAIRTLPEHY